ncbi:MAG: DUF2157 domain-containing protein [Polyangiales bacterium]
MGLRTQLGRWKDHGLIDDATATRIAQFEATRHMRPYALYAVGGLGALAVGLGLIALVGANWENLSDAAKLIADIAFGAALAWGVWRARTSPSSWLFDSLILVYVGYILASFALIGQIYQQDTPTRTVLALWTALSVPALLLTRSRICSAVLVLLIVATYFSNAMHWIETFVGRDRGAVSAWLFIAIALPTVFLVLAALSKRLKRDAFQFSFEIAGWIGIAALGFASSWSWRDDPSDMADWSASVCFALAAVAIYASKAMKRSERGWHASIAVIVVAFTSYVLPWWWSVGAMASSVSAVAGIFVLAVFAWAAKVTMRTKLFALCTAAIGFRLLSVMFVLLGSLMSTGIALIFGGALTLLCLYLWSKFGRIRGAA